MSSLAARSQQPKSIFRLPDALFTKDQNCPQRCLNSSHTRPEREGAGPFASLTPILIVAVSLFSVAETSVA